MFDLSLFLTRVQFSPALLRTTPAPRRRSRRVELSRSNGIARKGREEFLVSREPVSRVLMRNHTPRRYLRPPHGENAEGDDSHDQKAFTTSRWSISCQERPCLPPNLGIVPRQSASFSREAGS